METENSNREGDWIATYSGKQFWPLDPSPQDISIQDIAHALSIISRFTGHCLRPYSVAQHSVLVAHAVPREIALEGLMHDSAEAYLSDVSRPLKKYLPEYQRIETTVEKVIANKFGLDYPWHSEIKKADFIVFKTEAQSVLTQSPYLDNFLNNYLRDVHPLDLRITPWSHDKAELVFNLHFDYIQEGRNIDDLHKYVFN